MQMTADIINKVLVFCICWFWYLSSNWIIMASLLYCIVRPRLRRWTSMLVRFYAWPTVQEFGHTWRISRLVPNIVVVLSIFVAYSVTSLIWCLLGLHVEVLLLWIRLVPIVRDSQRKTQRWYQFPLNITALTDCSVALYCQPAPSLLIVRAGNDHRHQCCCQLLTPPPKTHLSPC